VKIQTIALMLLLLTPTVHSQGSDDVQIWWDNEYKNDVQPAQRAAAEYRTKIRCDKKIDRYAGKLKTSPEDKYYQWQLSHWKKKCL